MLVVMKNDATEARLQAIIQGIESLGYPGISMPGAQQTAVCITPRNPYIRNSLELMESTSPEGDVGKFIEKRGEGVFLISYLVSNVEEALADLKAQGHKLIDEKPRSLAGSRYAFINYPKELCGVLTEIMDKGD